MSAKVLGMYGETPPAAREPDPYLVAGLEKLLEQARSGEVQGVAYVAMLHDKDAESRTMGLHSMASLGHLTLLALQVSDALWGGSAQ